jgi:hypothetical protein
MPIIGDLAIPRYPLLPCYEREALSADFPVEALVGTLLPRL